LYFTANRYHFYLTKAVFGISFNGIKLDAFLLRLQKIKPMYTTNFIYKAPAEVLESLRKLFSVLNGENVNFQRAVSITDDRQLKNTLLQFVQASKQYANELKCQIESLGGGGAEIIEAILPENKNNDNLKLSDSKEILDYCCNCEMRVLNAYREILNHSFMLKDLRGIMRYQLNEMLCSFLQFKMLKGSFQK
jgi:hypothetical protein